LVASADASARRKELLMASTALLVVLALAFALFGYRMSVRHFAQRGVTPWRFPSIVWGLICFAIGPIGILVELFAGVTTRPSVTAPAVGASAPPEVAKLETPEPEPMRLVPALMPPKAKDGSPAPFGWYADVTKRHEYRYFDGKYWSDQVADGGATSTDPL
jgi:Protein of unknown function (DUF2510)